jgi:hypothetical protein
MPNEEPRGSQKELAFFSIHAIQPPYRILCAALISITVKATFFMFRIDCIPDNAKLYGNQNATHSLTPRIISKNASPHTSTHATPLKTITLPEQSKTVLRTATQNVL